MVVTSLENTRASYFNLILFRITGNEVVSQEKVVYIVKTTQTPYQMRFKWSSQFELKFLLKPNLICSIFFFSSRKLGSCRYLYFCNTPLPYLTNIENLSPTLCTYSPYKNININNYYGLVTGVTLVTKWWPSFNLLKAMTKMC